MFINYIVCSSKYYSITIIKDPLEISLRAFMGNLRLLHTTIYMFLSVKIHIQYFISSQILIIDRNISLALAGKLLF